MDDIVLLKILISFFVGGGVICLVTFLSERLGSTLGAILAGTPTTLAISLLFQGMTISPQASVEACGPALVGLAVFGIFCSAYVYLFQYPFILSLIGAMTAWLFVILLFILMDIKEIRLCFVMFIIISGLSKWILDRKEIEVVPVVKKKPNSPWVYILRFLLGGGIIAFSVLMGVVAGEIVGGVFAAFPALAMSSILILNHSMGREFTITFAKNIFVSAAFSVGVYIMAVYYLYLPLDLLWGTVAAYTLSIIPVYTFYRLKTSK